TLLHDRDIEVACDDSVIRTNPVGPIFIRRARGYVPKALDASHLPARRVLALGADLKVTPTTLNRGEMVVGRHIGNLDNIRTEAAFRTEIQRVLTFAQLTPEVVAVDLHPEMFSVLYAEEVFADRELIRVQHHHAHLAAVLFEHRFDPAEEVLGIVLDGMGYGPDGTIWGGEVLVGSCQHFQRVGHLRPVPQPGGDKAAIEPKRMATSLLLEAGLEEHPAFDSDFAQICSVRTVSPLSSSTGRLFDGVAAIIGIAPSQQSYEGQAPALLEALVDPSCTDAYPLPNDGNELDTRVLIAALVDDKAGPGTRAARFHHGLADGLANLALQQNPTKVVLAGGSMVNRPLAHRIAQKLGDAGCKVYSPQQLPAGDGGLSAGQAAVAACTCATAQ
ncbi:MAG: carbamoyltransferase HypF, partial [Proteobacteria bacterium]|nr:carbamoyltransferase HypF [Pseudomonadota bacterium]